MRNTIIGFILVHFVFAALSFLQLWLVQAGDRVASRFAGGHATVLTLMVLVCVPLMVTTRLVPAGSAMFFPGLCAGFFLMLACYGPSMALAPRHMWATTTGLTMLGINVFAIAIGNLAAGVTIDHLRDSGDERLRAERDTSVVGH